MSNNAVTVCCFGLILSLAVLFGGEPDLMDAIVHKLTAYPVPSGASKAG